MPYDENKQQELRKTMNDHNYSIGDLVSYCNRPAMVTFVSSTGTLADIICLDDYIVMNVGTQQLHFLAAGQHYLREAQAYCRTLMLVEKLSAIKEEHNGQH
nr:MAG TPA: hypothetical protein [Caudoviricetes sp.]